MWLFKEKPIIKQIKEYNKDKDILLEFARNVHKPRIEEITLEDIKTFYKAIVEPQNSLHTRNCYMLALRKFFRENRGTNTLNPKQISDNPLISGELNVTMVRMKKIEKRKSGRPIDWENVKRTVKMKDELGMSLRTIGKVIIKGRIVDHSQIYKWYRLGKKSVGELSTG